MAHRHSSRIVSLFRSDHCLFSIITLSESLVVFFASSIFWFCECTLHSGRTFIVLAVLNTCFCHCLQSLSSKSKLGPRKPQLCPQKYMHVYTCACISYGRMNSSRTDVRPLQDASRQSTYEYLWKTKHFFFLYLAYATTVNYIAKTCVPMVTDIIGHRTKSTVEFFFFFLAVNRCKRYTLQIQLCTRTHIAHTFRKLKRNVFWNRKKNWKKTHQPFEASKIRIFVTIR